MDKEIVSGDTARNQCSEFIEVLYEYVDGECCESLRVELQHHIDSCPSCLRILGIEQQVRELLRSCCAQPAPGDLKARISAELRVQRVRHVRQHIRRHS